MRHNGQADELIVDFLVPARLASRYRARLAAVSAFEAELRLAFCPMIFRSGILSCCPAEITSRCGAGAIRLRGMFHLDASGGATVARFRFDEPVGAAELHTLERACPASSDSSRPQACAEPDLGPGWLQPTVN